MIGREVPLSFKEIACFVAGRRTPCTLAEGSPVETKTASIADQIMRFKQLKGAQRE
jgi:hypothetical protein